MISYLGEFIEYINTVYQKIDETKRKYFQDYFSKASIVKRLFDESSDEENVFVFFKKINFKIKSLKKLKDFYADNLGDNSLFEKFYDKCLFEINEDNIDFYGDLHKKSDSEYKYSDLINDSRLVNYLLENKENKSFEILVETINKSSNIREEPRFLLFLIYSPLEESFGKKVIEKIDEWVIDYTDAYTLPDQWNTFIEEKTGSDSLCKVLIENNKLKRTWNNFIFSYGQLSNTDKDTFLTKYLNDAIDEENFKLDDTIHKRLKNLSKKFFVYLFESVYVNENILNLYIHTLENNDIPFLEDARKYLVDENDIEIKYVKWQRKKCIVFLRCFLGKQFNEYKEYSKLICYLVKANVYDILDLLNNNSDNAVIDKRSIYICIYASLLYHSVDYIEQRKVFAENEVDYILMKVDLYNLKCVIQQWKKCFNDDKQLKYFVNEILSNQIIVDKFKKMPLLYAFDYLNDLKDVVNVSWLEMIMSELEERIGKKKKFNRSALIARSLIYKYLGEMKNEKYKEDVLKKIWEDIPRIREKMSNIQMLANQSSKLNDVKLFRDEVSNLYVKYESQKQYLTDEHRSKLENLVNCFGYFADRCVLLCAKTGEMEVYERAKNGNKIAECGEIITKLIKQCQKCLNDIPSLYADVEKLVLS